MPKYTTVAITKEDRITLKILSSKEGTSMIHLLHEWIKEKSALYNTISTPSVVYPGSFQKMTCPPKQTPAKHTLIKQTPAHQNTPDNMG